ncbi:TonB-dependent receptor [Pedobacter quisquiliarum]|uniref:TonB-dependent receptor n=2 Tax=Pedobacter quisquiliarum TaxID=1834438 RepID=A0A916U4L7_9SPHI|nr:TonB-dependent receptor [Pedobacter quisquiliarum]
MYMHKTLLFIFLSLICFAGNAQTGSLSGRVTNENGAAVEGATLKIKELNRSAITDMEGKYELRSVKYGSYTLVVSALQTDAKSVSVKVGTGNTVMNVKVKSAGARALEQVFIEGKTEKKTIETSGFAINVVETKEASLRNVQTNELLDRTVGVRVRQNGGLGSAVEYNLNGMSGRSVGIFIDGIEISTYGSSFNLNSIPPSMVERIEVYKGVLPAHLSGDYMGGAINVVLKKDISQNNIAASISYGSFNTYQVDASAMYRNSKNGFTAKASGFYTYTDNSYETWGKFSKFITPDGQVERYYRARRFNDSFKSTGGRFELGFTNVKWADALLLGYNGSSTDNEIPHGQVMAKPYVGRTSEAQAHVFNLIYNKKDLFTNGLSLNVNGVYSDRSTYLQDTVGYLYNWDGNYRLDFYNRPMYREGYGQQGLDVITDISRRITTLRSNLSYDIFSGHRLSINHVYYTVDRDDEDLLRPVANGSLKTISDLQKQITAFNYEAQLFGDKLKTNLFLKYYQQNVGRTTPIVSTVGGQNVVNTARSDKKIDATGYGLAASYALKPKIVLIASAEQAVRMPGDTEILGDPNENVLSNFSIRPEVARNINLGFRLGNFEIDKHRISVSGNAFSRNIKDRIVRQVNSTLSDQEVEVSPFMNIGRAKSLGFEAELGYAYSNRLNVMFTFSKFNSVFKQGDDSVTGQRLTQYEGEQLPNEPFFTMNGNAQYRLNNVLQKNSLLNLFYNFGYVAPFRTVWPESEWFTTPTQFAQDLGLSYKFPDRKLVVSLDAKNILNAEIYDNFGVQKPGRAFFVKLNYSINRL